MQIYSSSSKKSKRAIKGLLNVAKPTNFILPKKKGEKKQYQNFNLRIFEMNLFREKKQKRKMSSKNSINQ